MVHVCLRARAHARYQCRMSQATRLSLAVNTIKSIQALQRGSVSGALPDRNDTSDRGAVVPSPPSEAPVARTEAAVASSVQWPPADAGQWVAGGEHGGRTNGEAPEQGSPVYEDLAASWSGGGGSRRNVSATEELGCGGGSEALAEVHAKLDLLLKHVKGAYSQTTWYPVYGKRWLWIAEFESRERQHSMLSAAVGAMQARAAGVAQPSPCTCTCMRAHECCTRRRACTRVRACAVGSASGPA
jgi:hypothetical protein